MSFVDREKIKKTFPFLAFEALLIVRAHHQGAESRTEHEGAHTRQTYGARDRDTELREERTGRTAHERHRDEHRHENEGTGDNCYRHFAHCLTGCLNSLILRRALHLSAL